MTPLVRSLGLPDAGHVVEHDGARALEEDAGPLQLAEVYHALHLRGTPGMSAGMKRYDDFSYVQSYAEKRDCFVKHQPVVAGCGWLQPGRNFLST